jgi:hypothetical protein
MKKSISWNSVVHKTKQLVLIAALAMVLVPNIGQASACGTHYGCSKTESDGHGGVKNVKCGGQGFLGSTQSNGTSSLTDACYTGCDAEDYTSCTD